jgi:hypothetical protein
MRERDPFVDLRGDAPGAGLLRLFILAALNEDDEASARLRGAEAYGGPADANPARFPSGVFHDRRV